jgi:D-alanine--poly(phosphoribitol) ligase subunit 1
VFVLDAIKKYAKSDRVAWYGHSRDAALGFAALEARSEAFAAWLLARLGSDRSPVVVYGSKHVDFLPCVFGALKSGRAYVPVDSALPPARAKEIAEDVQPKAVIDLTGLLDIPGTETIGSSVLSEILRDKPEGEIPRGKWVSGNDTAYILFTSGSTGRPKGVPITAENIAAFDSGLAPYYNEITAGHGNEKPFVVLDQVSYSFDVSCCSLYAGLSRGMTLFAIEDAQDMAGVYSRLGGSGLGLWVSTPSFAELCLHAKSFRKELLPELRAFLFCGEALTHKLCDELAGRFPNARILNTYGPTEATVLVSAVWVTDAMRQSGLPIPIGAPIAGTRLERDDKGELLIIGESVGPGYLNRPDLTGERFFTAEDGLRGYRTGDICEMAGGLWYYRGRADNQIKLNGYRVELEDIEKNLAKLPNVLQAAVVPVWEDGRVRELAAFVLLEAEDGLSPLKRGIALKKQAAELLPAYMLPRRIIALAAFPLNINGKRDRKALAALKP